MKKNYVKPSLLSETFVTESIMAGEETLEKELSNQTLYGTTTFTGLNFGDGNMLNRISFDSLKKSN